MESETKTARNDQKSSCFFLKIQDIRKSKTPIFENFLGQLLTINKPWERNTDKTS